MAGRVTAMLKSSRTFSALQSSGQEMFVPAARRLYSPGPDDSTPSGASPGGAVADEKVKQPKKSRTGGDMTDDGQVYTPSLDKTRSTADFFDTKKKETEDRQSTEKENA